MKNYFLALLMLFAINSMSAQVKTPSASPFCKVEQGIGLTDVTLEYSRPSVKDRTISEI